MIDVKKMPLTTNEMFNKIEASLLSFCNITKLPVTFYNKNGMVLNEYNSQAKICKFLDIYNTEGSICKRNLVSSIQTASTLGEPYIFVCSSGFIKIAITLMVKGEILGCFMVGPLVMEKLTQRTIAKIIQLNGNLSETAGNTSGNDYSATLSRIFLLLKDMKIYSTKEVSSLANLLNNCIIANLWDSNDYINAKIKYNEQVKVGEALQNSKKSNKSFGHQYELENQLIQSIKRSANLESEKITAEIFQSILLNSTGNIDFMKIRLIEICTVLSRAAVESGAPSDLTITRSFDYINDLNRKDTIQDLEHWVYTLIRHFLENASENIYSGDSQIIRKITDSINEELSSKLSLSDFAKRHHINASYLSVCFKKETGYSFTDYINIVRIKKSKDLLEKTNLRLIDVSTSCGFEDQSYFSKVFKFREGCTPSQYRKKTSLFPAI